MTPLGKFTLRLGIYGAVLVYLACDLFVIRGPLKRRIERMDPRGAEAQAAAGAAGVVARVFNHPITDSQLERALRERLWLEGKTPESITPESRKIARMAALNDLIDHELLRVKAKANASALRVGEQEIETRYQAFAARFESPEAMEKAMKSQGMGTIADLRDRIAARIQQEKYVESKIGVLSRVSEEEARDWYDKNRESLALPERIEARHVFLATLDRPEDEAKAKIDAALADLTEKRKDFATLALELSEDESSKHRGGALGWMTRSRLPADFAAPVFDMPLNRPARVRTKLGWHLVEVTGRKPAEPRAFEDARSEITAALETIKRGRLAAQYRNDLRTFEREKIEVFHHRIKE